jgi:hypothetical protein
VDTFVTHKRLSDHGDEVSRHQVLYPLEVFAAAYSAGDACFAVTFLGEGGEAGLEAFWDAQRDHEWVRDHPGFAHCDARYAIPLGVHADKGAHVARDKLLCISFGSLMSRASTSLSKYLFTVVPDELIAKGKTEEELYAILVAYLVHIACTASSCVSQLFVMCAIM